MLANGTLFRLAKMQVQVFFNLKTSPTLCALVRCFCFVLSVLMARQFTAAFEAHWTLGAGIGSLVFMNSGYVSGKAEFALEFPRTMWTGERSVITGVGCILVFDQYVGGKSPSHFKFG